MPTLLRPALLLATLALGGCNFWIIPIPIPLGTRELAPVPANMAAPPAEARPAGR